MIVRAGLAVGIRTYRTGITGALLCLCSFEQPTARQQGAGFFMDVCTNYTNKDSHFAHRTIQNLGFGWNSLVDGWPE
jgi:ribosome modulation factor